MTKFFTFPVGQSCCSALKSWAARQRRPTKEVKILVMRQICSLDLATIFIDRPVPLT
jgi:hypothetical protein